MKGAPRWLTERRGAGGPQLANEVFLQLLDNRVAAFESTSSSLQDVYTLYTKLQRFFELLAGNSSLVTLSLSPRVLHKRGELNQGAAGALRQALASNGSLRFLTITNVSLGTRGLLQLAAGLRHNASLRSLTLGDVGSEGPGYVQLFRSLSKNSALRSLTLRPSAPILRSLQLQEAFSQLSAALARNSSLTHLALHGLVRFQRDRLFSLAHNTTLRSLQLCDCDFGGPSVALSLPSIKTFSALQRLDLSDNPGLGASWHDFALGIPYLRSLRILRLRRCGLRTDALAQLLPRAPLLQALALSDNDLQGSAALAPLLASYAGLQELDLSSTQIHASQLTLLLSSVPDAEHLHSLTLNQTALGSVRLDTWTRFFLTHHLTHLSLDNAELGDGPVLALAETLAGGANTLQSLSLAANSIGSIGASALFSSLQFNCSLRRLVLSSNSFDFRCIPALHKMIVSDTAALKSLALSGCFKRASAGNALARMLTTALPTELTLDHLDITNNDIGVDHLEPLLSMFRVASLSFTSLIFQPQGTISLHQLNMFQSIADLKTANDEKRQCFLFWMLVHLVW
ncbi:MAG: hypothetical protein Q8P67_15370 [archaeon]|nr:hypothetical protein [archaeon]